MISTKAPYSSSRTTLPVYTSPSSASAVRSRIICLAASAADMSIEAMRILPSSSISILALVWLTILLMIFPAGPMTSPTFSGLT